MNDYYADKYNLDSFAGRMPAQGVRRRASSSASPRTAKARHAAPKRAARTAPKRARHAASAGEAKRNSSGVQHGKPSRKQQRPAQKPAKKSAPKSPLKVAVTLLIVVAVAAAGVVIGVNMYHNYRKSQPFRYSARVTVSGIDISGLLYDEALQKLKDNSIEAVDDFTLTVTAKGRKTNTVKLGKEDFSYKFDYKTPLAEAKEYSLREQGLYEETGPKKDEETTEFTTDNPEFRMNYSVLTDSIDDEVKTFARKVNSSPKNAKVSKFTPFAAQRFEYKEGIDGYRLEQKQLSKQIADFIHSGKKTGKIKAEVSAIKPDISSADLKEHIVGLSTATSYSSNTEAGTHNMAVALKACNGSVIKPGETWSFNKHTGDSNLEKNGYKKATVINERRLEEGVGGGICQASTTIFKAAAFANMDIIERHNHYWASGYASAGEDATIDYPNLDLKLRNTTECQMFMECRMDGRTLRVNIFGWQESYYDNIKLYSENYDIVSGQHFRTKTQRVLYKEGKIVSEETICTSYYSLTENHAVRPVDTGTYRTMVNGTSHSETEPTVATAAPETGNEDEETEPEEQEPDEDEDDSGDADYEDSDDNDTAGGADEEE